MGLLAMTVEHLRPITLVDAFTGERRKAVSLAFMASLRGECHSDVSGIVSWLESKPWPETLAVLSGKRHYPTDNDGSISTLERIGGMTALLPAEMDNLGFPRTSAAIIPYAVSLKNAAQQRALLALLGKITTAIEKLAPNDSPQAYASRAIDRITETMRGGSNQNIGYGAMEMLNAAATGVGLKRATWGLSAMDALCPLRAGGLHILAAPPRCGKTSLALQAAALSGIDAAAGTVAIVSLEMTAWELASVLIASKLEISATDLREGRASPEHMAHAQEIAERWIHDPSLYVDDTGSGSVDSIGAWARQRKAAGTLRLLVIDYLQLLKGESRDSEYTTISKNTRALKMLAKDLDIPILCLSQLSRKGREDMRDRQGQITGTPEPRLSDLRGSGTIEQDADTVTFIHNPQEPEPHATIVPVRIIVRKNRGGPEGCVDAYFFKKWQTFSTTPPADPSRERDQDQRQRDAERAVEDMGI